mgnify:CR=1 FL=1
MQVLVNFIGISLMIGFGTLVAWYKAETHSYTTTALASVQNPREPAVHSAECNAEESRAEQTRNHFSAYPQRSIGGDEARLSGTTSNSQAVETS